MNRYQFELTSLMPLLMHADNIDGADELQEWRKDPVNKGISVPGDDRSPPWTWQTYLYHLNGQVVMPSENLMAALRTAGAQLILKRQKTFKEATQSGMIMETEALEFLIKNEPVAMGPIHEVRDATFREQVEASRAFGFNLDVRRAKVGS